MTTVVSESSTSPSDGAPGFRQYGSPALHDATDVGDGGHMFWTYTNGASIDNMGDWRPNLPDTGNYEVYAFIPRNHATTKQAHYEIYAADGRHNVTLNQFNYSDAWVSLGTYPFSSGSGNYVRLTDGYSENYDGKTVVGFDTVKWEKRADPDSTAPNGFIDSLYQDGLTLSGQQTLNGWANDPGANASGVKQVQLLLDGNDMGAVSYPVHRDDGNAGFQLSWNADSASPGQHTVRLHVVDNANNVFNLDRSVNVVRGAPPTIAFTETNKNQWFGPSNLNTQIVWWSLQDQGGGLGGFSQNWDTSITDGSPAFPNSTTGNMQIGYIGAASRQGKHTAYIRAWNSDHSRYTDASSGWYGYDALPPTVSITSGQTNGATYTAVQHIAFHVADPDSGLSKWGAAWDTVPGQQASTSDGTLDLAVGTHTLHVHAWDNVGNEKDWTFGPFTYQPTVVQSSSWTAACVSVGGDNWERVLWTHPSGAAALWLLNPNGQYVSQQQYGPFAGWTCREITTGRDCYTRVLWARADGAVALWIVDPNNNYVTQQGYGPYQGWTCKDISAAPDGGLRALWVSDGGAAALWRLDNQNRYVDQQQYGPFTGWTPTALKVGPDNSERLMWTMPSAAAIWRLNSAGVYMDQQQLSTPAGWTATQLAVAPDGWSRVVWVNTDGHIALWRINSINQYVDSQQYGPYAGWAVQSLAVGPDSFAHLLWDNAGGAAAFWRTTPTGDYYDQVQFGPF